MLPRASAGAAALAVLLLALGVVFALLYHAKNNEEHHSFNAGARAAYSVHLTKGKQYELSTPGGVKRLDSEGIVVGSVGCTYSPVGSGGSGPLTLAFLGADTRTVHAIATFQSPVTGRVHIQCTQLGGAYIDDADDAPGDPAGLFILLATCAFTAGAALGLSVLYRRPRREHTNGGGHGRSDQDQGYQNLLARGPYD